MIEMQRETGYSNCSLRIIGEHIGIDRVWLGRNCAVNSSEIGLWAIEVIYFQSHDTERPFRKGRWIGVTCVCPGHLPVLAFDNCTKLQQLGAL